MQDKERRPLTIFLGECWHSPVSKKVCSCGRENVENAYIHASNMNRTFTTPADAHALVLKLQEKGMWGEFTEWVTDYYDARYAIGMSDFMKWIFDPARFCEMVNEFLKETDQHAPRYPFSETESDYRGNKGG